MVWYEKKIQKNAVHSTELTSLRCVAVQFTEMEIPFGQAWVDIMKWHGKFCFRAAVQRQVTLKFYNMSDAGIEMLS